MKYETAAVGNKIQPSIEVLNQIADCLNVDIRDLLVSNFEENKREKVY